MLQYVKSLQIFTVSSSNEKDILEIDPDYYGALSKDGLTLMLPVA